jgi:pimeloyl-ACP methyl ester carboxylesterase
MPSTSATPVLYLPSLTRPKNEAKSSNLQAWCRKNDHSFLCADYYGVGRSSGKFTDGSVGRWAQDTITLIQEVLKPSSGKPQDKVVLVGHGVGAWISFVVAMKRPDLVSGIVGLAADPDFTEELLWKTLSVDIKDKIMREGVADVQWGRATYPISRELIEDGRKHLLLSAAPNSLPIRCPVRLIHSITDEEVPFSLALKLVENCASSDASVTLVKGSSNSMEGLHDMTAMRHMVQEVMDAFKGDYDLRSPGSG